MPLWSARIAKAYASMADESRVTVLHPWLLAFCGEVLDNTVLDFGCGDARFASHLVGAGAKSVTCIDESPEMIAAARHVIAELPPALSERVTVIQGNESMLPAGRYDLVVCSLVLMMISQLERLQDVIGLLLASVERGGRLVLAVTHPWFRLTDHGSFVNIMPPGFRYWDSGAEYQVVFRDVDGRECLRIRDYHWTLTNYSRAIHGAGGLIDKIGELKGDPRSRDGLDDPAYLCLRVIQR